ncbi:hypothetical protein MBRA_55020 (plasmid) [Mycobacterium branderi]|uniref:Uncharacterized protein n=1 Tax=Mycobacterium branderi TaxID=43348 RepID=A0ABM7KVT6_9MYCO|nr:hypothetical protein MBRA_55020 [Mycobacterium branderi]
MAYGTFHATSVKTGPEPAGTLQAALATVTRVLDQHIREAETNLDSFRLVGISHAHTITPISNGAVRAELTAIASYEYD